MPATDHSFRAFSGQAFFREVNAWLVDRVGLDHARRVADVACGSGLVTELVAERMRKVGDPVVVAVDSSTEALRDARARLAGAGGAVVEFVQGRAEHLSAVIGKAVDAVLFCNAVHYVEDKHRLFTEVRRVLRAGGTFAFNTSFFQGAEPPETLSFYRRWMLRALRLLKERHGISPDRTKVAARRQLTAEQYVAEVERAGFTIRVRELVPAVLPEEGWLAISEFADFAEGALPGVPLAVASEVLCDALRQTFATLGLEGVPRNWLSVVAVRS
jgi:ubiquinone/menaquinone biosynthesis C-methylase UbiE